MLTAAPGFGKSTFMVALIQHARRHWSKHHDDGDNVGFGVLPSSPHPPVEIGAWFVLSKRDGWDFSCLLPALEVQLRLHFGLTLIEDNPNRAEPKNEYELIKAQAAAFQFCLADLRKKMGELNRRILIIIDGLDQGLRHARPGVVRILSDLWKFLPEGLVAVISSRPGEHLKFLQQPIDHAEIVTIDRKYPEEWAQHHRDIRRYIGWRAEKIDHNQRLAVSPTLQQQLIRIANGNFAIAVLLLADERTTHDHYVRTRALKPDLERWGEAIEQGTKTDIAAYAKKLKRHIGYEPNPLPFRVTNLLIALFILPLPFISIYVDKLDRVIINQFYFLQTLIASEIPENIITIGIDDASMKNIGLQWPWPRDIHAQLIHKLNKLGAKTIVFDFLFAELDNKATDNIFADALNHYDNVILAGQSDYQRIYSNNKPIRTNKPIATRRDWTGPNEFFSFPLSRVGFININHDLDGVIRSLPLQISDATESVNIYALSYVAAKHYANELPDPLIISDVDENSSLIINFSGPPGAVDYVPYYQALQPDVYLKNYNPFAGKLIFIGAATNIVGRDSYSVPHTRFGYESMRGVELHANAAHTLLKGNNLRYLTKSDIFLVSFLLCLMTHVLFYEYRKRHRKTEFLWKVFLYVGIPVLGLLLFLFGNIILSVISLIISSSVILITRKIWLKINNELI